MTRQSILLVDDELVIRQSLKVNLEKEGFEVYVAESAESALPVLKERPFDLLLTDYLLEVVTGLELMRQARELYPEIKGIIFSGYEDETLADEMRIIGVNSFLCKPIDFDVLLERISEVMAS